jgi:hypothetical protein
MATPEIDQAQRAPVGDLCKSGLSLLVSGAKITFRESPVLENHPFSLHPVCTPQCGQPDVQVKVQDRLQQDCAASPQLANS